MKTIMFIVFLFFTGAMFAQEPPGKKYAIEMWPTSSLSTATAIDMWPVSTFTGEREISISVNHDEIFPRWDSPDHFFINLDYMESPDCRDMIKRLFPDLDTTRERKVELILRD